MKIALAQQNYHIGNFEGNFAKISAAIAEAKNNSADIVVFTELSICGYPPRDFLEFKDFITRCEESVEKVASLADGIAVIVGAPAYNPNPKGKDLYNSAFFLADKKIQQVIHKTLLPTYDIFDEVRYFESNTEFKAITYKGKKFVITICEDLWNSGYEQLYVSSPLDNLMPLNPEFIINISASPFDYNHAQERISVLKDAVAVSKVPIFYCNAVGAQTDLIFDGGSLVINANGNVFSELSYFKEEISYFDLDDLKKNYSQNKEQPKDKVTLIHDALILGIRDYFQKSNLKKCIIGLSGGIDSAVVCVLAVEALGKDNVHALLMPSQFSSTHSVTDAEKLSKTLGIKYDIIPIEPIFNSANNAISPFFAGETFDVTEENIQARIRAILLMAMANKFQYILLNTSNKSELAVGYGTLYGDMSGGLSVIGDVYKTQVYELAHYINRKKTIIPENITTKAPSAELRPNQKDSDSLPEYDVLDKILFQYIERRQGPKELVQMGFAKSLVDKTLKLVNSNEYKRNQTPPILRVSPKAFGMGRRLPIVGKYLG
jgi:NAD+ synthase (glutamine-hydrolysing)